jgi:RNA polymerase sigma factor (TIGR02999 family)
MQPLAWHRAIPALYEFTLFSRFLWLRIEAFLMVGKDMSGPEQITAMLAELAEGGGAAQNRLFEAIYGQLRRLAAAQLRLERPNHTLQPTALVHEACMRLLENPTGWKDREHLFRTAAKIMRQILTDYARAKRAVKRGANQPIVTLRDIINVPHSWSMGIEDFIALDAAIERLKSKDKRQSVIVELRFFVGLTEDQIAEALQISPRTVKRDWESARAWLYGQLKPSHN